MSKAILIGYEIKSGTFPNEKTGELISYNNRVLRFITNDGETKDNIGYAPFEVKFKMADLAKSLGVGEGDGFVNDCLSTNLHKEFEIHWRPVNGSMTCVGVSLVKRS